MRELLRTSSVSFAESVRLACEGEGILVQVSGQVMPGYQGDATPVRVMVSDADYDRAREVLRSLPAPVLPERAMWRQSIGIALLIAGVLAYWVSTADFSSLAVVILRITAAILSLLGAWHVIRGVRAENQWRGQKRAELDRD